MSHKQLKNGISCIVEIIFGKELFHKSTKELLIWKQPNQSTRFSVVYAELPKQNQIYLHHLYALNPLASSNKDITMVKTQI